MCFTCTCKKIIIHTQQKKERRKTTISLSLSLSVVLSPPSHFLFSVHVCAFTLFCEIDIGVSAENVSMHIYRKICCIFFSFSRSLVSFFLLSLSLSLALFSLSLPFYHYCHSLLLNFSRSNNTQLFSIEFLLSLKREREKERIRLFSFR